MPSARKESGRGGRSSAAGRNKRAEPETPVRSAAARAAWLALVAAWAFVLLSAASYDRGDAPTHSVYPANASAENLAGPAGAVIAHHLYKFMGWPAWVLLLGLGPVFFLPVLNRSVGQPLLRVAGLVLLTAALCGMNSLLLPTIAPMPDLAGGSLGVVVGSELAARFNVVGSLVWLVLLAAVGAVVAFDRYLILVPKWLWHRAQPAAGKTGAIAGAAAVGTGTAAKRAGGLLAGLSAMIKGRKPVQVRLDDLEDDDRVERPEPAASRGGKERKSRKPARAVEEIDEEALDAESAEYEDDEEAEPLEVKTPKKRRSVRAEDAGEGAENEEDEEGEEDEELPGAPQVFSRDELKAKIAKLPVRFAGSDKQTATEDDLRDIQSVAELKGYKFPGVDLLEEPEENFSAKLESLVREQAENLEAALGEYRIEGEVVGIESGPVITQYDVRLAPGTKVSKLQAVSADVARSLKAVNVRIVANQAGRDTVGIEVPNPTKEKVRLKELMSNRERFGDMKLPMFLGKDAAGDPLIADLTQMPHMLIAGTTGSGKSVCMNTIIMSFLYTKKPNELKLVLVDPKMVEMSQFRDIPHLMCPVVTEMGKAAAILEWACTKMDERYELLAEAGVRDIASYNELEWEELKDAFEPRTPEEEARIPRRLPYMVFIIDELADLMMTNKEVESSIIRIAQKARAVGIHLILATQRPQANVVTGLIKSNMPCRITFKVASGMDSRIVLDQKGGELLLGQGDMLFLSPRSHKVSRAQGTLVDDKEIRRVVRFMRDVAGPTFERQLIQLRSGGSDEERLEATENHSSASLAAAQEDPLFDRAVEIVLQTKRGSVSLLQRRLAIGYTRASRLIDLMGIAGIISEHKGSVARDVMITPEEWEAMKALAEEEARVQRGELFGDAGGARRATLDDEPGQDAFEDDADLDGDLDGELAIGPDDAAAVEVHSRRIDEEPAPWEPMVEIAVPARAVSSAADAPPATGDLESTEPETESPGSEVEPAAALDDEDDDDWDEDEGGDEDWDEDEDDEDDEDWDEDDEEEDDGDEDDEDEEDEDEDEDWVEDGEEDDEEWEEDAEEESDEDSEGWDEEEEFEEGEDDEPLSELRDKPARR
ncbi:MAG: DNA translocase FtsK [Phycisphaerales bacterium JB037]